MLHERIYLDETDDRVYMDTYVGDLKNFPRNAMLVLPGGGYRNVCTDREGEPIALAYVAKGFNAFVLNYRVGQEVDVYPSQLLDAARAVMCIKKNAQRFNIDPERVFAVGFSAGGHLAGSLGLMAKDEEILEALGATEDEVSLKGIVLSYPVVTAQDNTHKGSFEKLTGMPFDEIPEALRKKHSLEERVDLSSPAAFIWHTAADNAVPPVGSLKLCAKYIENKVPVSLRIYPYGCHGIALADEFSNYDASVAQPLAQNWLSESVDFINTLN